MAGMVDHRAGDLCFVEVGVHGARLRVDGGDAEDGVVGLEAGDLFDGKGADGFAVAGVP